MPIYQHLKTGNLYKVLHIATDATNARDGHKVVVYKRFNGDDQIFVRDYSEFDDKFKPLVSTS